MNAYPARIALLAALIALCALPAMADFSDGNWRLELSGGTAWNSGGTDRDGDILATVAAEYEFLVARRLSLGLRLLPLLIYTQDSGDDWRDDLRDLDDWDDLGDLLDDHDDDTVFGAGAGLSLRVYSKAEEMRGFFLELQGNVFGHKNQFEGNDSNINFLSGAGLGYKFKFGLHLIGRLEHISNAGLGDRNSGINTVSLGLGYSF